MKFKFKIQQYQTKAADAVVDVFRGQPNLGVVEYLRDLGTLQKGKSADLFDTGEGFGNAEVVLNNTDLFSNIKSVQMQNQIKQSNKLFNDLGACQLDIEMETGTGKTYVYTKTMFELNKHYGWTKFIVVVPSIAIREGVYKSLQNTEQHFFEQYGKSIKYFIYDSDQLNQLDSYSQSSDICAMIINMQAFNTMAKNSKNKTARIMYSERDEFGSRRPIDVLAANRPIIIQDEPQKMGGKKTQEGVKNFNPLFCLNYSATHKDKHNMVYVLDALDAYNQRLVKRIEVKGFELNNMAGTDGYLYLQDIAVYKNKAPQARIEFKKLKANGEVGKATKLFRNEEDIYTESGEMEAYRNGYTISEIVPDTEIGLGYVRFLNGQVLEKGQIYGDSSLKDMRRIQIRETIKSHFVKERALFERGIKCLSLFFIDEVANYRIYDEEGNALLGEYGEIFEEEYEKELNDVINKTLDLNPAYSKYLQDIHTEDTHKGYFSIDKKGHMANDHKHRKSYESGEKESDDISAYDLILKDKERLLSFEEPTRFIFSHSALREGWDNPNIFQICTLKHSDSETGKRQEVGRGLRICVNRFGDRQDYETLQGDVHNVNVLTVIASESYGSFVDALQKDIKAVLRDRPQKVIEDFFANVMVQSDMNETYVITEEDSRKIYFALAVGQVIDIEGQPTEEFRATNTLNDAVVKTLPENLRPFVKDISSLVQSVYDPHALDNMIQNGSADKVVNDKLNDNFYKKEFQELWNLINSKHVYTVDFDEDELRRNSIDAINKNLRVSKLTYKMTIGTQQDTTSRQQLDTNSTFKMTENSSDLVVRADTSSSVKYDLVGEVARAAKITRRSAAYILARIEPGQFAKFEMNPEMFIAKVGDIIRGQKANVVVDHIQYHTLDDKYDQDIFTSEMPFDKKDAFEAQHSIQDWVVYDSDGELEFVRDLDTDTSVAVYAKLPRTFKIPTPVGNYAPDWAIAFKEGSVKHIYFVAETKGSLDSLQLRDVEKGKIACAKKLFDNLENANVKFDVVTNHKDLIDLVME